MARRNRNDKLTVNPKKSPYWLISFRIPKELYDHPLFVGRNLNTPFQKSTGETDYGAATRVRDRFFREQDIFQPKKTPDEHYADVLSGQTILTETDRTIIQEELAEQALDGLTQANTPFQAMMEGDIHKTQLEENPFADVHSRYTIQLSRALSIYKQYRQSLPKKTLQKIENAGSRFIQFVTVDPKMNQIKRQAVFRHIQQLSQSGTSRSTIQNDLSFLGSAFEHCQSAGYINEQLRNPFRGHDLKVTPSPNKRLAMPLEHARGLYESAEDQDCRILIALGHFAGLRISEAFPVVITNDDSLGIYLDIASDFEGKTEAATRKIPAASELTFILKKSGQIPEIGSSVKISWSVKTISGLDKRFRKLKSEYFEARNIEHENMLVDHSFRHAFATYLANRFGELLPASLTGHKGHDKAVTELGRTYFHGAEWGKKVEMINSLPPLQLHGT